MIPVNNLQSSAHAMSMWAENEQRVYRWSFLLEQGRSELHLHQ